MRTSFAPEFDTSRARVVPVVRNSALYEAGSQTRRTIGWRAPTASANAGVLSNLTTLRDRSRAATRNDGYAKGIVDKKVANVIGTGIKPMSLAPASVVVPHPVTGQPVPLPEAIEALWLLWTDESDADGLLDFYGQQEQAVRAMLEGGESFTRIRPRALEDGLSVPLQLQVLEPELCPHTHNAWSADVRIRAGIEFNRIGRRVAYWLHPARPELDDYDASQLRPVPAHNIAHLFEPLRPGQLRGLPVLTQALITLHETGKYKDATILKQQLSNMFVAFLKRPPMTGDAELLHPMSGQPVQASDDGKPLLPLEPGMFQELDPGQEVQFSTPPPATGYPDFMRQVLFGVAAATNVPYEVLTGDMRGVNDRTVRVVLNEFRRHVQALQHHLVVHQFCRPIWQAWMDRVFLSQALPIPLDYLANPKPWTAVKWVAQGWPYIHPVQDIEADKQAVRSGFTSRSGVVSGRGEDVGVIDREQAEDNARADRLRLRYDSDGRTPASASSLRELTPPTEEAEGVPA